MSKEMLEDLGDHIQEMLPKLVTAVSLGKGELSLAVEAKNITKLLQFLRDNRECLFSMLLDITAVDYPGRKQRFDVVYHLLSIRQNQRIRIKVSVADGDTVPSVGGLFSSAGWYEREVFDLYGVVFEGHADLRRILTDYGFEGHPLRKDFPLTGYVEVRYDEDVQRVVYEPVKLTQDFRNFDFESPWEGMTNIHLPGDEKAEIKTEDDKAAG